MAKYHQSYQNLRQFCEKWQWIDPRSGQQVTGYVHPQTASFNPHTHEGCDLRIRHYCRAQLVSIHTPTKGVT